MVVSEYSGAWEFFAHSISNPEFEGCCFFPLTNSYTHIRLAHGWAPAHTELLATFWEAGHEDTHALSSIIFFLYEPYSWILKNLDLIFFFFHFKSVEWPVHMDIKKYNQQVFVVLPQNPRHLKSVSYCFSIRLWIFFPQVVFLTGFGCVYVDTVHQGGTIFITVAPEGKAGSILTNTHR